MHLSLPADIAQDLDRQSELLNEQLGILDPLAENLRRPAASHLASATFIILGEIFCWTAIGGVVALAFFLKNLYPTDLLFVLNRSEYQQQLGAQNVMHLRWFVYGLLIVIAFLFYFLSRGLRAVRRKNSILRTSGRDIRTLVGQHLTRRAHVESLHQKYFHQIPAKEEIFTPVPKVNEVLNPGYEYGEE